MRLATLAVVVASILSGVAARADDWPCYRGPARNGVSAERGADVAGKKSVILWRAQVGKGHSAVSVVGDRAYTMGWDGQDESVYCLDAGTGKVVWREKYFSRTIKQWPGPRATPTVADGMVYTLGQHGELCAWAAKDGRKAWGVKLDERYRPDADYGFPWSPLVAGELLILGGGTRGLGVRRGDGSFAWGNDGGRGACASAVPFEAGGRKGVAVITQAEDRESVRLVGVEASTGKALWRHGPWREKWGAACVDLLVDGGNVFITTSEALMKSGRFTIDGTRLKEDWGSGSLASYTGGCVLLNGAVYAVSQQGKLTCLDWETGWKRWDKPGFDEHGSLIATADGYLFVQTGKRGDLVVAEAAADREVARVRGFEGDAKTFTAPALSGGRVWCRSYAGEVVCVGWRD